MKDFDSKWNNGKPTYSNPPRMGEMKPSYYQKLNMVPNSPSNPQQMTKQPLTAADLVIGKKYVPVSIEGRQLLYMKLPPVVVYIGKKDTRLFLFEDIGKEQWVFLPSDMIPYEEAGEVKGEKLPDNNKPLLRLYSLSFGDDILKIIHHQTGSKASYRRWNNVPYSVHLAESNELVVSELKKCRIQVSKIFENKEDFQSEFLSKSEHQYQHSFDKSLANIRLLKHHNIPIECDAPPEDLQQLKKVSPPLYDWFIKSGFVTLPDPTPQPPTAGVEEAAKEYDIHEAAQLFCRSVDMYPSVDDNPYDRQRAVMAFLAGASWQSSRPSVDSEAVECEFTEWCLQEGYRQGELGIWWHIRQTEQRWKHKKKYTTSELYSIFKNSKK